jgi:hypothetical protein
LEVWQINPDDVIENHSVWICDTVTLDYGLEITEFIQDYIGNDTRAFLFHADQDLYDFEIFDTEGGPDHEVYVDTINGQIMKPPFQENDYFSDWSTAGEPQDYVHFYGGDGIPYCTFFDVYVRADSGSSFIETWDPAELSIHPTPVPGALLLLGSGFVGLVGFRRFRRK